MQKKKNISSPKAMNRDNHSAYLQPTEYTLAVNANTENESGEKLNITNEPSNYLATIFPEGFKVVGFKYNLLANRTYFWLVNPSYPIDEGVFANKSSVGYIEDLEISQENADAYNTCIDCSGYNELGIPLETIEQTPFNSYVTLFDDIECSNEIGFDINFPIKSIEIKNEKGEVTAYWDDYKNPSRYAVLSDVSYLYKQIVPCDDDIEQECIFVDKLLHFPNHNVMNIQAESVQVGGNIKLGTYEFWGVYCDIKGNNIVNYSTPTQPVKIFDENNNLLEQTELDSFTNYAIRLTVNNLDTTFPYYKIVCVERTNVANTQSAFVVGIFPTTDNTVLYTSSGSSNDDEFLYNGNASIKRRVDINELYQVRPTYETIKGTASSSNILWKWGLKEKETLNLQPVVNLFSSLLKWQTSVAKESLFKNPVACSKFSGIMRNEVQPYAIRTYDLDGNYSSVFPFIGRPAIGDEKTFLSKTSGTLVIGDTYVISKVLGDDDGNDDFTNVGFVSVNIPFEATDSTPTVWTYGTIVYSDINSTSLGSNTPSCTDTPLQKWQVFNTATEIKKFGDIGWNCEASVEEVDTEPIATQKECVIENVGVILGSTETLTENIDNYVDLKTYIQENPLVEIPNLTEFLDEVLYSGDSCLENISFEDCPDITLIEDFIKVDKVQDESIEYENKITSNYQRNVIASSENVYQRDTQDGTYLRDTDFEDTYTRCDVLVREVVYKRNFDNIQNEQCNFAVAVINNNSVISAGQAFYHNYYAEYLEADLKQSTKEVFITDTHFKNRLHKGALWFKAEKLNRDLLILEITKNSSCSNPDDITNLAQGIGNKLRYNIYKSCSDNTPIFGDIFNTSSGVLEELDVSSITNSTFYIAIDAPMIEEEIPINCSFPLVTNTVFKIVPPCGVFTPFTRDIEYASIEVTWSSININKYEKYQANCIFKFPKVSDCEPTPYANGEFAYWESINEYPDNAELYDSSNLTVLSERIDMLSTEDKDRFELFYGTLNGEVYDLNNADFRCQPIRHPKMPDNTIAPFISNSSLGFSESLIFPLGVHLDESVVKVMLQVALDNNLISQKQHDNIAGYEILRGDNVISKSIIANGLGYDMYKYSRESKDYYYSNYPFNDLGEDQLHYTDVSKTSYIPHPFAGDGNNKFTIISPDLTFNAPTLPTQVVMSGYQKGVSSSQFSEVKEHPKWTILGRKARNLATTLATLEAALELAIGIANSAETYRVEFKVGTGSSGGSTNFPGIALAVASALAAAFATPLKAAQYRYQWLKTFRDLGAQYNFASYNVGEGFYNSFSSNLSDSDYIRGLSLSKYMKDGEYKYIDENSRTPLYVNNYLREHDVLISLGESAYNFNYDSNFKTFDDSRVVASQVGCSPNQDYERNIGSPYFTLKNNIPDQFGTIDSVKWLTTNYHFKLNEHNSNCTTIFGGTVTISRFTWKRKIPLFKATAMGLPNKLAVEYSPYKNIGEPRFFCDYETDTSKDFAGIPIPDIDSTIELDCLNDGFYIEPNSKFYLYYYGIVNFLVESEINCNFRYGKREPKNQFHPQVGDLTEWTQEVNVPIKEPNTFYYNNVYSLPVSNSPYKFLDATYSKDLWAKRANQENAVIYSEPDNSQNDIFDSWRVFKPLNWNEFDKKYGKLIGLKDLESSQLLVRFENGMLVLNAVDSLADRITPQNKALGTAGIFATRPKEFTRTDLGFAGTQNTDIVSTPYGHFSGDAKRGKIFMINQNAGGLEAISESLGGKPTNMKNWFKENLPFKILKYFPNADIDNKFKGLGLNIWYDSKFDRVFFTKRDYITKQNDCTLKYSNEIGFYTDCEEDIISCPEGYTYNDETETCEKIIQVEATCSGREQFNFWDKALEVCGEDLVDYTSGTPSEAKCAHLFAGTLLCGGFTQSGITYYVDGDILVGSKVYYFEDSGTHITTMNGNFVTNDGNNPGIPEGTRTVITVVNGIVTAITDFNDLPNCI